MFDRESDLFAAHIWIAMISVIVAGRWSAATPGYVLENKRLALRYDRLGFIVQSLLQSACIFLVAGRLAREF